jgi:hypothetical protein
VIQEAPAAVEHWFALSSYFNYKDRNGQSQSMGKKKHQVIHAVGNSLDKNLSAGK